jgi:mRNA interferase HigB
VRVIAKPALVAFWRRHPDAEKPLMTWHKLVRQHSPANFAQLKQLFPAADAVDNFVIFDIGGNKYRIVARVLYTLQAVFIRNVLTHAEYDAWKPDQDAWSKKGQQQARLERAQKPGRKKPQTTARKQPTKGGKGKP